MVFKYLHLRSLTVKGEHLIVSFRPYRLAGLSHRELNFIAAFVDEVVQWINFYPL